MCLRSTSLEPVRMCFRKRTAAIKNGQKGRPIARSPFRKSWLLEADAQAELDPPRSIGLAGDHTE